MPAPDPSQDLHLNAQSFQQQQQRRRLSARIRNTAEALGFDLVRFTTIDPFIEARTAIHERIALGFFEGMDWFTSERATVSTNPRALLPNGQSLIALGTFYLTAIAQSGKDDPEPHGVVAKYALGDDYHDILRQRLQQLESEIQLCVRDEGLPAAMAETRHFVDAGRMVDRVAAQRAGIGWFGKNTNILSRQWGSWLFLSEIVTCLDLEPDQPIAASCGKCHACLDACPTHAFVAPGVLDARKCISYLTIEHRGAIPLELRSLIGSWIFGCDICQDVCPVNHVVERRLQASGKLPDNTPHSMPFQPHTIEHIAALLPLLALDEEGFRTRFRRSPIKRAKRRGLLRNVCVALGNIGDPAAIPALALALHDAEPLIRGHAAWALGKIGGQDARTALLIAQTTEQTPEVRGEIQYALANFAP